MDPTSTQKLSETAFQGDREALRDLLQQFRPYLRLMVARRLTSTPADQPDIEALVQHVCQSVESEADQLEGLHFASFQMWLRTGVEQDTFSGIAGPLPATPPSPRQRTLDGEDAVRLAQAMARLEFQSFEAVRLRHIEGWPLADIAERLQLTDEVVGARLRQGLCEIATALNAPALDSTVVDLDVLVTDYARRCDSGEIVDRDQLVKQHSEIAHELTQFFSISDLVEEMAGPRMSDLDRSAATVGEDETIEYRPPGALSDTGVGGPPRDLGELAEEIPGLFAEEGKTTLGNYELLELIGRGGMGVVCKARQPKLNRIVAIKMIREGKLASARDIQRFNSEAQAAGKLDHANIVSIHQFGEAAGYHFYSMDYIEGTDLAKMIKRGDCDEATAARYIHTIARAVHFAHEKGVLHRDLKPANILIDEHDAPRVTDFGLAKHIDTDLDLTPTGTAIGTPSYMSPEQAGGDQDHVDRRSDVYALGAILYEMLTGRPPFRNESPMQTILEVLHKEPPAPSQIAPRVNRDLETICLKCLQKDPAKRYQTAGELAADLDCYLRGEPIHARPVSRLVRAWYWTRGIPVVAALTGRKLLVPTPWQRRAQWIALATPLVLMLILMAWSIMPTPLPRHVVVASGREGGMYYKFSIELKPRLEQFLHTDVRVQATKGSGENLAQLQDHDAALAIMQGSALLSDQVQAVAPLYYEPIHILVRRELADVNSVSDLAGRRVSVGPEQSGMRFSALKILTYYGVPLEELRESERPFTDLDLGQLDAAIVTTGLQNPELIRLLRSAKFRLLSVDDQELSLHRPSFKQFVILPRDYPEVAGIPPAGIKTVASTALLVTSARASDRLVTETLNALYAGSQLASTPGSVKLQEAAGWVSLSWHPAARRFYDAKTKQTSPTGEPSR